MQTEARSPDHNEARASHAPSEVRIRGFVIFLIGFIVFGGLVHLVAHYGYAKLVRSNLMAPASPLAEPMPLPPKPRLEGSPAHPNLPQEDLKIMRQREQARLSGYGWSNRESGLVHIPIRRAMQLVLERGLPKFQSATTTSPE